MMIVMCAWSRRNQNDLHLPCALPAIECRVIVALNTMQTPNQTPSELHVYYNSLNIAFALHSQVAVESSERNSSAEL
jgi:hypothetical protein